MTYLEEPHHLDRLFAVESEAMVDACRKDKQIAIMDMNADPLVCRQFYGSGKRISSKTLLVTVGDGHLERQRMRCHPVRTESPRRRACACSAGLSLTVRP